MLQTRVGKRTGAAALRMAVDMVRPSDLGISKDEAVSRVTDDHLDSVLHPQFAGSGYTVLAKGLGASPGAAVGQVYFTADDAAAAADAGRAGHPGPQRDVARGRARHAGVRGHPDRPRRPRQPRRRRRPRLGQARRRRRRGGADRPRTRSPWATSVLYEGDWISLDGASRHRGGRRGAADGGRAARRVRHHPRRGPTTSARASWRSGPTPTPVRTPPTPASSAPRASDCAAPSTCSWARIACRSCGG